ncbi:LysE family transporter [Gorillibacterium sp. CAU 1737]|uniref:LysE family transporter n=1 Tax=Gorillibacterium sp. CAU 1737 TaxID=3140362 RepID=UPI0032608D90
MQTLMRHFLLGLSLAAPIGPINAAQMDRGLRKGFLHAWLVGVGAMLADGIFMLLVYFGVIHFLSIPFMQTFLWLFGFFILTYIGVESFRSVGKLTSSTDDNKDSLLKSFTAGFLMSLLNPLSILFWLGIYGSVLTDMVKTYDAQGVLLYSSAIMTGILVWDVSMALLSSSFRRMLTPRLLSLLSIVSGLSLIGFGLYFGYQALLVLLG